MFKDVEEMDEDQKPDEEYTYDRQNIDEVSKRKSARTEKPKPKVKLPAPSYQLRLKRSVSPAPSPSPVASKRPSLLLSSSEYSYVKPASPIKRTSRASLPTPTKPKNDSFVEPKLPTPRGRPRKSVETTPSPSPSPRPPRKSIDETPSPSPRPARKVVEETPTPNSRLSKKSIGEVPTLSTSKTPRPPRKSTPPPKAAIQPFVPERRMTRAQSLAPVSSPIVSNPSTSSLRPIVSVTKPSLGDYEKPRISYRRSQNSTGDVSS